MEARRAAWDECRGNNTNECCFDLGLVGPLREFYLGSILNMELQDFLRTDLAVFLKTLISRVVVTSTPVEMQFSKMTQLMWNGGHKKLDRHGLASKMATFSYTNRVRRWRARRGV